MPVTIKYLHLAVILFWPNWQSKKYPPIDSFHIVISLSNRSSIEKSIKLFFENEGAEC